MSAGTNADSTVPLSSDLIEWADVLVLMEQAHKNKVRKKFHAHLNNKRIVVLGIPDDYEYRQPELVELSKTVALVFRVHSRAPSSNRKDQDRV